MWCGYGRKGIFGNCTREEIFGGCIVMCTYGHAPKFFHNCNLQNLSKILLKFTRFSTGNIDWTRLWVTDGIRIWLHTCEGLWACLVTTRPSGSRSRWSWRMFLSCEVLTPILQLKSLQIRWESCEFKSNTGSLVKFGVEVENGVYLRKICEKILIRLLNKIT